MEGRGGGGQLGGVGKRCRRRPVGEDVPVNVRLAV